MKFIDSHCHLPMLDQEVAAVLKAAEAQGVVHFLSVAVLLSDHLKLVEIADRYEQVSISAGLHPNELPGEALDETLLYEQAAHPKVVAIGETGLDFYRSEENTDWQRERFVQQIACAKQLEKPLIIHTRAAKEPTIEIMRQEGADKVGGVMHCFTEDWEMAKQALDLGFYISFSGIVTFKNATTLKEVAKLVPLDRILIETDCPYLAPVPHRGKPNEPAFVTHVAEHIAELRQLPLEEIAEHTTANYRRLFEERR